MTWAARVLRLTMCTATLCLGLPFLSTPLSSLEDHTRQRRSRRWRWQPEPSSSGGSGVAASSSNASDLFRFAFVSDTHFWPRSVERHAFTSRSDAQPIRDGLLVAHSPETFEALLGDLRSFAASGGAFAVHAGDIACGGASFKASGAEFEAQLRSAARAERSALPVGWPVHHMPGNHDLHPVVGGLDVWWRVFGDGRELDGDGARYYSLQRDGWRLVLMDSASGVRIDTDGHGHVGHEQLEWLDAQLAAAAVEDEQVILIIHQLLVVPTDVAGRPHRWFVPQYDLVSNAHDVLSVLKRHAPIVRLVLHGHVHANSLTMRQGVAFVTTSSASEYPMMWREIAVRRCEVEMSSHALALPTLLEKSAQRDTRGVNDVKKGDARENHLVVQSRARKCTQR